ncbi:MAG: glucose-6-phosphate dehydrogenase assembly protein OpcA [Terriglobales bacterium]
MQVQWQPGRVSGIEKQWRALRQAEGMAQPQALAMNLICRVHDESDMAHVAEHLWALGPCHLARVFLVARGGNRVNVRVASHPEGSEFVELTGEAARLPGVVAPLLVDDLPVLLLWRGSDPAGDGEFMAWASLASRVLVDAHRLRLSATRLLELAHSLPTNTTLGDLTWTRLTPWRQLLCQGLEGELANPDDIDTVTISAGGIGDSADSGGSLAATLFAGWMAQKLQWQPGTRTAEGLRLTRAHAAPVLLRFEAASVHECLLKRVVIEGGTPRAVVAIEHRGPYVAVTVTQRGSLVGEWMGASAGESLLRGEQATLCEELSIHSADWLYREVLERGLALMAGWEAVAA